MISKVGSLAQKIPVLIFLTSLIGPMYIQQSITCKNFKWK